MNLLQGKPIATAILDQASHDAKKLHALGVTPTLAAILVGYNPSSKLYISLKKKIAKELGIDFLLYQFSASTKQVEIEQLLITLHLDNSVHGIIVQLPLPEHLDTEKICQFIDPDKDVDGLLPASKYKPPAPYATIELIRYYDIDLRGAKIGLFGKGRLVGQPLKKMLIDAGAQVTVFDADSENIAEKSKQCEVLISATGKSNTIKPEYVESSQVIIDVGGAFDIVTHKTIGDISPHARKLVRAVTPRLGGIGPITVAVLMRNVIIAAKTQ